MGDEPVHRLALRRHGAALGGGDARGDLGEFGRRRVGQGAFAELQRADQGAMHDEIGVAADRRGEMRVTAQVEAEMPIVFMGIFRLRLRAQDDFIDDVLVLQPFNARQNDVEMLGLEHLALGELDPDRGEKLGERRDLLLRGLVMGAVDEHAGGAPPASLPPRHWRGS